MAALLISVGRPTCASTEVPLNREQESTMLVTVWVARRRVPYLTSSPVLRCLWPSRIHIFGSRPAGSQRGNEFAKRFTVRCTSLAALFRNGFLTLGQCGPSFAFLRRVRLRSFGAGVRIR